LFTHSAVVAVPKTNHVIDTACYNEILIGDVNTSNVALVVAVDLFAGDELVALLGLRQTKESNPSLPASSNEPEASLVATESKIGNLLL
jgi:hypothetical protein